jgi:lysine/ornithine N-monooxygenase
MRRFSIQAAPPTGDLTPELEAADWWTDEAVAAAGIPVREVPFVTVGGGMGSFVTVDYLRIAGVPRSSIRVLTNLNQPWQTYEYLTRVSQIPRAERIRSDAASRPDNVWGFPSYALQEAFRCRTLAPLWQVLVEPVFADFYTPRLGIVLRGVEREARRIGYQDMVVRGEVRMVRRRTGGGYFTVLTPKPGTSSTKRIAFRSRDVHVAVGYPGLKFLPDLQRFRLEHRDFFHAVNAYEDHEHVYTTLRHRPGTVLVRGGGIVASRILERLMRDRQRYGLRTQIVHLLRSYVDGSHGPHPWSRRRGGHGFAYQGFNYPKSVWGGQLKARMRRLDGDQRAAAYAAMGGTTTVFRRSWQRQLAEGRRAGWYRTVTGTIEQLRTRGPAPMLIQLRTPEGPVDVSADFVIDCTGLEADVSEHRVLGDLLTHGGAGRNPLGRLEVERTFELRGAASGDGRLYVSGAAALGGYFPGVDTFLGLQIAAQEIADDLARRGVCRRIGTARSVTQWLKWMADREI